MVYDVIVVGGGAAGFFTAANIGVLKPDAKILILERGNQVLSKVKVSGGGRCNITHAEFDPNELVTYYPRGEKELRGPFHHFCSGDTVSWFEERGVVLKIEEDGRMFPVTNSSQTVIDCLLNQIEKYNIKLYTGEGVTQIDKTAEGWNLQTNKTSYTARHLVIATGSSPKAWRLLQDLGHRIVPPVPSLFTFNIKDVIIKDIPGISVPVSLKIKNTKLSSKGALLITHWGLSGPVVLKLSAWGARELYDLDHQFHLWVNWLDDKSPAEVKDQLKAKRTQTPGKTLYNSLAFPLPKRLWRSLLYSCQISETLRWADLSKKTEEVLAKQLTSTSFKVTGKSTFKEEFVTAGGVHLKEIDFKKFESKLHTNLYMAGEVLNIDAITGGFNFQNAWTGGYIVATAIAEKLN